MFVKFTEYSRLRFLYQGVQRGEIYKIFASGLRGNPICRVLVEKLEKFSKAFLLIFSGNIRKIISYFLLATYGI
jgi:hypothetical protein